MAMQRVWNVTDWPGKGMVAVTKMVLGSTIAPGRAVQVDSERLKSASKVHQEVKAGHLFIGSQPPESYLKLKKPAHAVADARRVDEKGRLTSTSVEVSRAHGKFPGKAIAADAPAKIEAVFTPEVKEAKLGVFSESYDDGEVSKDRKGKRR